MDKNKNIDKELNAFLTEWDSNSFASFLKDVLPITELYAVDDDGKMILSQHIEGDQRYVDTVMMIRTAYLMSRFIDFQTPKLLSMRTNFKGFWKRLEQAQSEAKKDD